MNFPLVQLQCKFYVGSRNHCYFNGKLIIEASLLKLHLNSYVLK